MQLRDAYLILGRAEQLPAFAGNARWLLSRTGGLHSLDDVAAGRLVRNDHPALADAVEKAGVAIAFADPSDEGRALFARLGLRWLTDICGKPRVHRGVAAKPRPWFREADYLDVLHSRDFATALSALANHDLRNQQAGVATSTSLSRRLREIGHIDFVDAISLTFRMARASVTLNADAWVDPDVIWLRPATSREDVRGRVAALVASLVTASLGDQQRLADATFRLLGLRGPAEIAAYLRTRGVDWRPTSVSPTPTQGDEHAGDQDAIVERALDSLTESLTTETSPVDPPIAEGSPVEQPTREVKPEPAPPTPLPSIDDVVLTQVNAVGNWSPRQPTGKGSSGGWRAKTQAEVSRDQEVGHRAEELVWRDELARVRAMALDEGRVVWVAQSNPAADHDIRSVDADGTDLFLEVKGTTGTDGSFKWPAGEFKKALRERSRYVLCRVYEADSDHPFLKRFRDPVGMFSRKELHLNVESLAGEVEPLRTD